MEVTKKTVIYVRAGSPVTLDAIRYPVSAYTARQCYANVKRVIERLAASFNSTTSWCWIIVIMHEQ